MSTETDQEPDAPQFTRMGFVKTNVIPALLVFVIPVFSWWFFQSATDRYDGMMLQSIERGINADTELDAAQKEDLLAHWRATPVSRILATPGPQTEEFKRGMDSDIVLHYAIFRWMVRSAALATLSGVVMFFLGGLSVLLSLRSQQAQYLSLSVGWHLLRLFATGQVVIQGCLAIALSYWVTALWAEMYVPKLIVIVAILALVAVGAVIKAIFTRIDQDFAIEGDVLRKADAPALWESLESLCDALQTDPPDQVIAGIDDNFFVTEHTVTVDDKSLSGRTLFVSLSLLRKLNGSEADAVLAHEMAHFSGNDTLYTKKISPLLNRYGIYLAALYEGVLSRVVFYVMVCFRGLFEVSLGRRSREREFRADRIAVEQTSAEDLTNALVKIAAYSSYRGAIEQRLFEQDAELGALDIAEKVEAGFAKHVDEFLAGEDLDESATAHPFDSHPPTRSRFEAVGREFAPESFREMLLAPPDGRWLQNIPDADAKEKEQWKNYEDRFREFHEQILAYRYLPETERETELVRKLFPELTFAGKKAGVSLVLNHEKLNFSKWDDPVLFSEILNCEGDQSAMGKPLVKIELERNGKSKRTFPLADFESPQDEVTGTFEKYYSRFLTARDYRAQKEEETGEEQG